MNTCPWADPNSEEILVMTGLLLFRKRGIKADVTRTTWKGY
jgi:hypothetical protein